ncbi:F-box/RNI-like superfamily protein [Rhynchospora pubera]|uniref:F-box/RNI-like superfamily protein n=1 Tax=Rhynchospora pubera TaxID=906938 RepID=A0AAV8DNQ5_9POAL|nr:F-box/RNI-like superfamily protein [Rhynchospora pubera]
MASTDWISELPDSMLHHIMSFMKARAAVRTCVLSKRWRRLWASLQRLHFDFAELEIIQKLCWNRKELVRIYSEFISRMLQERESIDVHTFDVQNFYKFPDADDEREWEWISYAVNHKARVIHFATIYEWGNLPQSIYTCSSLEELHVFVEDPYPMIHPSSVSLPRLRSLDLSCVDHHFLKLILVQCPALESLDLAYCSGIDLRGIPFQKLRKLTVSCCTVLSAAGKLSLPSLESFYFEGSMSTLRDMGIESMPSLTYAYAYFYEEVYEETDASFNNDNSKILNALTNASKLEFYGFEAADLLHKDLQKCPTFFNLAELSINGCATCHSDMIARMLESSPYLQKLTISHNESHKVLNRERTAIKGAFLKSMYLDTIEIKVWRDYSTVKPLIEELADSLEGRSKLFNIILIIHKYADGPIIDEDFNTLCSSLAQQNPQIKLSYKLIT